MRLEVIRTFDTGQPARYAMRAFLSILPDGDGFIGVCREFTPEDSARCSDLWLLQYDAGGRILSDRYLCHGEDPRLFWWRGSPHVLTWTFEPGGDDWDVWLIQILGMPAGDSDAESIPQLISGFGFMGKNWVPLLNEDALWFIRSLDPLRMLRHDGVRTDHERWDNGIGQYRGGSAAKVEGNAVVGFGHRTLASGLHRVFRYEIDLDCPELLAKFTPVEVVGLDGMGVIDPTSAWPGHVAITATPGAWSCVQPCVNAVCRIVQ